jgi:hypothetical protein
VNPPVARIAYDILEQEDPEALNKATELLRVYSDSITSEKEKDFPFVECVTLADDNKRRGGGWQSSWHFKDNGFSGDEGTYNFAAAEKNLVAALPDIFHWLRGDDVVDSTYVNTLLSKTSSKEEAMSLGLRLAIHFMGDIHQPLHLVSRYTNDLPNGDKGGNLFALKNHYGAGELHAVFDNVMYLYHTSIKRPFTS